VAGRIRSIKKSTSSGLEPATFRLVEYSLSVFCGIRLISLNSSNLQHFWCYLELVSHNRFVEHQFDHMVDYQPHQLIFHQSYFSPHPFSIYIIHSLSRTSATHCTCVTLKPFPLVFPFCSSFQSVIDSHH
jgi:hypothetical protein